MQHQVIIEFLAARSNRVALEISGMANKAGGGAAWSGGSGGGTRMSLAPVDDWKPDRRAPRRIQMARLEADMAYFQARIELIGEPRTCNQRAQCKLFEVLHKSLGGAVLREKKRLAEAAARK